MAAANTPPNQIRQFSRIERRNVVKVIASGVRKGNVIEHEDGKLYVVLKAESMHPGKGTPTTTIDMRRISDGVKTVVRYKTTDPLERAFVETITHSYLYLDGDNYIFMNPENYEQIGVLRRHAGRFRAPSCRRAWNARSRCSTAFRSRSNCRRA
jgi:translation elongation factor P/translation initiation factor 5A